VSCVLCVALCAACVCLFAMALTCFTVCWLCCWHAGGLHCCDLCQKVMPHPHVVDMPGPCCLLAGALKLTLPLALTPGMCASCMLLQLPVRALGFAPDAAYAVSAADGERLVAVWVLPQPGSKKRPGSVAAASLAVAQPVVQLATAGEAWPPVRQLDRLFVSGRLCCHSRNVLHLIAGLGSQCCELGQQHTCCMQKLSSCQLCCATSQPT
jgi:hypothetical protein